MAQIKLATIVDKVRTKIKKRNKLAEESEKRLKSAGKLI